MVTAHAEIGTDETVLDWEGEDETIPVRCSFLTGIAGSGKTYQVKHRVTQDTSEGVLCATTGIAAVNLGTITINSLLKYFDTESLMNSFVAGKLTTRLASIAKMCRNIYIDEVSMMAAEQLDILWQAAKEANRQSGVREKNPTGLGITLVGDMCQLPPIRERWIFEADCWGQFEVNTITLRENWRQGEGRFLDAINLLRAGSGADAAALLKECAPGMYVNSLNLEFDGTTIMSKNDEVDRFNWQRLRQVKGEGFKISSRRWCAEGVSAPSEWKSIPNETELKVGAYVMILANTSDFQYANGDCGWVVAPPTSAGLQVRLARNGEVVTVAPISRHRHESEWSGDVDDAPVPRWGKPWWDKAMKKFIVGTVRYLPVRLAYASTVHKSQGLTLDRIQLDIRNAFFGHPAMAYVAISRCRSAEGLRVVGNEKLLAQRCKIDPKVKRWI